MQFISESQRDSSFSQSSFGCWKRRSREGEGGEGGWRRKKDEEEGAKRACRTNRSIIQFQIVVPRYCTIPWRDVTWRVATHRSALKDETETSRHCDAPDVTEYARRARFSIRRYTLASSSPPSHLPPPSFLIPPPPPPLSALPPPFALSLFENSPCRIPTSRKRQKWCNYDFRIPGRSRQRMPSNFLRILAYC